MGVLSGITLLLCAVAFGGEPPPKLGYSEYLLVPVRVHLLRARECEALNCRLKQADVERVFGKINRLIWSQAGLQMLVESVVEEPARAQALYEGLGENRTLNHLLLTRPRESQGEGEGAIQVYFIHAMEPNGICFGPQAIFVKDSAELRPVAGGIDEPLPRVTAHEIGHALSLPHRQDTFDLMQSGTTGYLLNPEEVVQTREAAGKRTGVLPTQKALSEAEAAVRGKDWPRARALYKALAAIPVRDPQREDAAEQLERLPAATSASGPQSGNRR